MRGADRDPHLHALPGSLIVSAKPVFDAARWSVFRAPPAGVTRRNHDDNPRSHQAVDFFTEWAATACEPSRIEVVNQVSA